MPWEPYDKWSQAEKDAHAKEAKRINKSWGESKEKERRERVAKSFESEKSKVNSEASTSKNQSSSSKSQKM